VDQIVERHRPCAVPGSLDLEAHVSLYDRCERFTLAYPACPGIDRFRHA
jgi:hypothetical protein